MILFNTFFYFSLNYYCIKRNTVASYKRLNSISFGVSMHFSYPLTIEVSELRTNSPSASITIGIFFNFALSMEFLKRLVVIFKLTLNS